MKKVTSLVLLALTALSAVPAAFAGDHNDCNNVENCAGNALCSNDNRSQYITTLTDLQATYPQNAQLKQYIHDVGAKRTIHLSETEVRKDLTSMGIRQGDVNLVISRMASSDNSN